MTAIHAVDASFDQLTASEAACLKSKHTPLFIQCLWTATERPSPRVISLRNAHNGGLWIAGYISLNAARSGVEHVDEGRQHVPDDLWEELKFVAVDIELNGIKVDQIVAACDRVVALEQRPIIYTSFSSWTEKIDPLNSTVLAQRDVPLWNALWDGKADIDFPRLTFGGWQPNQVIGEQWNGGTTFCDTFVDRNTFILERFIIEKEDGDMPDEALRGAVRDLKTVVKAQGEDIEALKAHLIDTKNVLKEHIDDTTTAHQ